MCTTESLTDHPSLYKHRAKAVVGAFPFEPLVGSGSSLAGPRQGEGVVGDGQPRVQRLTNFVNGERVAAADGESAEAINPNTGQVFAEAPVSRASDVCHLRDAI